MAHTAYKCCVAATCGPEQSLDSLVFCLCAPYNVQPATQLHSQYTWHAKHMRNSMPERTDMLIRYRKYGQVVCCQFCVQ
jgi:hypothetical protein